jgi:hypothetical protein
MQFDDHSSDRAMTALSHKEPKTSRVFYRKMNRNKQTVPFLKSIICRPFARAGFTQ